MNQPAHHHTAPTAAPARVGQGTAVEQSRAAAEVQAAVVVAQQCPRNPAASIAEMEQVCTQQALAEKAFYSFRRAGSTITGPTVHLARELARCWGNLQYGLVELRRDDEYGESEMQAFAWDVQTNSRVSNTFIVPHRRDKKKGEGSEKLTELRDIYENNTSNGSRRVREAIFSVLPGWFVDRAVQTCRATLNGGGGVPLPQRVADAVKAFEGLGVTADRIEAKLGRTSAKWTEHDVTELGILFGSITRREISVEDAFPPPRVTAEEITGSEPPATGPGDVAWPEAVQPGAGGQP
ncbi:hypothetical protein ABZ820_34835 [Streptomyces diacarni]|uniref:hypothetical protein n=1 Tax=Streptomyces diacarni TaxID=2800381 RepID=UPI0033C111B7